MDEDDVGGETTEEVDVVEAEVAVGEDLQREHASKPSRDIRKRVDATRILTTEDFQLIGTTRVLQLGSSTAQCPLKSSLPLRS